ncbi:MAG: carbohydrate ABC transporter permease [Candidatus Hadarchaeum sp.]|uniref:carbohydrate ABC transporter permease n=1 Tax=Candidatus Hadarchaeum sp. TaxID=2883567 RepID=UPI003179719C
MMTKKSVSKAVGLLILLGYFLVCIWPIIWTLLTSIKHPVDAFSFPPKWRFTPTLMAYYTLWVERSFSRYLKNSLICSASTTLISVGLGAAAAYGLVRWKYKRWSFAILMMFLFLRMFPRMILIIPYYILARKFLLYDNLLLLTAITIALNQPFTIWLLRGFILQVPESLEEAALIDGCTRWMVFRRIILPVIRPGLATAAIFSFLFSYNEFQVALVVTGVKARTLPVAISEYGAEHLLYWTISAAGAISIALPAIVFALAAQKHLVKGLTFGAVRE